MSKHFTETALETEKVSVTECSLEKGELEEYRCVQYISMLDIWRQKQVE